MAPILQSVSYAGLPVIGADIIIRRGTKPGIARLRLVHDSPLDLTTGVLQCQAGGLAQFADMRPDLSTIRCHHRPHGKREYRLVLRDRRQNWPNRQVSGSFNVRRRDNTIEGASVNADAIANHLLTAAGEPTPTTASLEFQPECRWDAQPVTAALDSLCAILPLHVCRRANDSYAVEQTGAGASIAVLPSGIAPIHATRFDGAPREIHARLGPTWHQCGLELEAVGLDADGQYRRLSELTYRPSDGWGNQWPPLLSGVATQHRNLALRTVYRVYRVRVPQTLPFDNYQLTNLDHLILDRQGLVFGTARLPDARVVGTYWPYSDHYQNTTNCPLHSGMFTLDTTMRAVVFDYPVWRAGTTVEPASLRLYTGFHLCNATTGELLRHPRSVSRTTGFGRQTVDLPFLWRARAHEAQGCTDGPVQDNRTALETEVDSYLTAWRNHWDASSQKRFGAYAGVVPIDTSGNIAEVRYRVGRGLAPITEASQHYCNSVAKV